MFSVLLFTPSRPLSLFSLAASACLPASCLLACLPSFFFVFALGPVPFTAVVRWCLQRRQACISDPERPHGHLRQDQDPRPSRGGTGQSVTPQVNQAVKESVRQLGGQSSQYRIITPGDNRTITPGVKITPPSPRTIFRTGVLLPERCVCGKGLSRRGLSEATTLVAACALTCCPQDLCVNLSQGV